MAVVLPQSVGRRRFVDVLGFEDKAQVVEGRRGGKGVYGIKRELGWRAGGGWCFGCFGSAGTHGSLGGSGVLHEMRVAALDACFDAISFGIAHAGMDIELVGVVLFEGDMDVVLGDVALGGLKICIGAVAQDFQTKTRFPANGSHCHGNGKAYHSARAGDAYAHCVLQDVGTQSQLDELGNDVPTAGGGGKLFSGTCHTEGYGHRLGTSDGRHYFAV